METSIVVECKGRCDKFLLHQTVQAILASPFFPNKGEVVDLAFAYRMMGWELYSLEVPACTCVYTIVSKRHLNVSINCVHRMLPATLTPGRGVA